MQAPMASSEPKSPERDDGSPIADFGAAIDEAHQLLSLTGLIVRKLFDACATTVADAANLIRTVDDGIAEMQSSIALLKSSFPEIAPLINADGVNVLMGQSLRCREAVQMRIVEGLATNVGGISRHIGRSVRLCEELSSGLQRHHSQAQARDAAVDGDGVELCLGVCAATCRSLTRMKAELEGLLDPLNPPDDTILSPASDTTSVGDFPLAMAPGDSAAPQQALVALMRCVGQLLQKSKIASSHLRAACLLSAAEAHNAVKCSDELHSLAAWYRSCRSAAVAWSGEERRRVEAEQVLQAKADEVMKELHTMQEAEAAARVDFHRRHGKYLPAQLFPMISKPINVKLPTSF